MKNKDLSISAIKANLYAIPIVMISIVGSLGSFIYIHGWAAFKDGFVSIYLYLPIFLIVFILGTFLHEILHAASFLIFGKLNIKQIKIGIQWKILTPYAHCKVPIKAKVYRVALLMPAIILGFLPLVISWIWGWSWLAVYGTLFIILAGGDLLVLWIIRALDSNDLVKDHPSKCGCIIL